MTQWKIVGSETRTLHVTADNREDAVARFRKEHPNARLFSVCDGRKTRYVLGVCDACNEPMFSDTDNVGIECDLHKRCVDGVYKP